MDDNGLPHETPEILSAASIFTPGMLTLASFVIALLAVLIVFLFNKTRSRSKGSDLLLVGASDAGKTAILATLVYGRALPTHASLQTNSSIYSDTESNTSFRIIDIPGHPRIREQFQEYIQQAKAIAFVVDASTISRNGAIVAEHLHYVLHALTSLPPSLAPPSLLILAHKSDLLKTTSTQQADTLSINRVKTVLERELEKRRASQASGVGVEGLGEGDEKTEMGGLDCGDGAGTFKFDTWEGGEVTFLSTYVRPRRSMDGAEKTDLGEVGDGLAALKNWLAENM